jgi:amino acid transporter
LFEQDSIPVIGNVYLVNGSIWNSGDFPIIKEDLRLPLSINLNISNRILDFKITKESDPSIAKFNLKKKNNSLDINWDYFDPGYGFSFQIIYVGVSDPKFKLNGKVLDISSFTEVDKPENKVGTKDYIIVFIGYFCLAIFYLILYFEKRKSKKINRVMLGVSIFLLIDLLVLTWLIFFHHTKVPF